MKLGCALGVAGRQTRSEVKTVEAAIGGWAGEKNQFSGNARDSNKSIVGFRRQVQLDFLRDGVVRCIRWCARQDLLHLCRAASEGILQIGTQVVLQAKEGDGGDQKKGCAEKQRVPRRQTERERTGIHSEETSSFASAPRMQ